MKLSGVDENRPLCTHSQTPVDNIHKQTILKYEHCIEECFMYPYHRGTFVPNALHSLFQNNYTTQYPSQQKVRGVIIKIFFSKNYLRAVANGFLSHFYSFSFHYTNVAGALSVQKMKWILPLERSCSDACRFGQPGWEQRKENRK